LGLPVRDDRANAAQVALLASTPRARSRGCRRPGAREHSARVVVEGAVEAAAPSRERAAAAKRPSSARAVAVARLRLRRESSGEIPSRTRSTCRALRATFVPSAPSVRTEGRWPHFAIAAAIRPEPDFVRTRRGWVFRYGAKRNEDRLRSRARMYASLPGGSRSHRSTACFSAPPPFYP
jgi:hypothetical protein